MLKLKGTLSLIGRDKMKANVLLSRSAIGKMLIAVLVIIVVVAIAAGAYYISLPTAKPTPSPTPVPTSTPQPTARATHRIGVRVKDGVGEFYDRETGEKFVPRGNNYIRLANQSAAGEPNVIYHSTCDPGLYDSARVEQAFTKMKQENYNVVRVFINHLCVVDQAGRLSVDYVHNFEDFLQRAKTNNMFVMVVIDAPPGQYYKYVEDIPLQPNIDWPNLPYLTQRGIEAEKRFWKDFIGELIRQEAPLDYIFAYGLRNEAFFFSDQKPLTLTSGSVVTANGRSYDMSKAEDKQKMMDENLVFWIDAVRQAILQVDPTALVTIGFFQPQGPNPTRIGDTRVIRTYSAIWESSADFIDLHLYPELELNMVQYVENFEMSGFARKPIIMGEFGSFKSSHWSASLAAQVLQDWQVDSCRYGFDGWLLWTWDTEEQPELWAGLAESGIINQALSPRNRPDPHVAGTFSGQNIALRKSTTASRSLSDNPAAMAVDGLLGNWWGAGDFPPQWIEIGLQAPSSIGKIRLAVSQSPDGETTHRVWGKGASTGEEYQLLYEFRGFTTDGQVLEYSPPTPWTGIQFIKVETVVSPSWVSWREIEVIRAS
jgi:hypothetical protein